MKLTLVIVLVIAIICIKIYMLRKKSIKQILKQKLIMLSIVAVVAGVLWLSVPGFEFENPKNIVTEYVSAFLES